MAQGGECGCFVVSDVTEAGPHIRPSWLTSRNILAFDSCGNILTTGSTAQVDCLAIDGLITLDQPTSYAVGQVYTITVHDPIAGDVVITHTVAQADIVAEDAETSLEEAIIETIRNIFNALYAKYLEALNSLGCQPMFELQLGTSPCSPSECWLSIRSTYPGIPLVYDLDVEPSEGTDPTFESTTVTENVGNLQEGEDSVEACVDEDTIVCAILSYAFNRPNIYRVIFMFDGAFATPINTLYRFLGTSIPAIPVSVGASVQEASIALAAGINNAIAILGASPDDAFATPNADGVYLYLTQTFIDAYSVDLLTITLEECALDGTTCTASSTASITTSTVPIVGEETEVVISDRVCDAWMPMLQKRLERAYVKEAAGCSESPCFPGSARIFAAMQAVRVVLAEGDYNGAKEVLAKAKVDFLASNPCAPVTRC